MDREQFRLLYMLGKFCLILVILYLELPGEEESDASVPLPGAEDMVEDDISSR